MQALTYHPLERLRVARPVERIDYIVAKCAGLRVLDLGALDGAVLVDADGLVEVAVGDLRRHAHGVRLDGDLDVAEAGGVRARRCGGRGDDAEGERGCEERSQLRIDAAAYSCARWTMMRGSTSRRMPRTCVTRK